MARLRTPSTELLVRVADDSAITTDLHRGSAEFEVVPSVRRTFRVRAGAVEVAVLGTIFTVERRGAQSRIQVLRGRVRVSWPDGRRELEAGARGDFPPIPATTRARLTPEDETPPPEPAPPATPPELVSAPEVNAPPSPRDLPAAPRPTILLPPPSTSLESPPSVKPALPDDLVDRLLREADRARIERRPGEAVATLERLLREHPGDPRAPLAAFTAGRVLLEELREPARAAMAFARARVLAPQGPLVEDVLAREMHAWWSAGDHARAARARDEYVRAFPKSDRPAALWEALGKQ